MHFLAVVYTCYLLLFSGCTHVTSLECPLGRPLLALRHLDLSDCTRVSDAGLERAARAAPHLANLYLRKCHAVTGNGLLLP